MQLSGIINDELGKASLHFWFHLFLGVKVVYSANNNQLAPYIIDSNIDIAPLLMAFDQFHEALQIAKSDLEKTGTIQYKGQFVRRTFSPRCTLFGLDIL